MVNMVSHEAFACSCAEGDVVLRQSFKPESYGKLYYACPNSKLLKYFGCGFFLWKETRLRLLMSSPGAPSAGPSTPPSYSSRHSTPPSYSSDRAGPTSTNYSPGSSRNEECSNCKHLRGKISVDWRGAFATAEVALRRASPGFAATSPPSSPTISPQNES
ncbi:hypothetical protein Tco_0558745 [Tanacetum coccineum]